MIHSFFTSNLPFNITTFVLAVLGIFFSVIFYKKSRKVKSPHYCIRTVSLLRTRASRIESLTVLYDGKRLEDLSTTKIAFWNAGLDTISKSDVSTADPLKITVGDTSEILSCDVLTQTRKANDVRVTISEDKKCALLSFEYLDKNDGVVINVRHNSVDQLQLSGSIKSVRNIVCDSKQTSRYIHSKSKLTVKRPMLHAIILSIIMIAFGFSMFIGFDKSLKMDEILRATRWLWAVLGLIYIAAGVFAIFAIFTHRQLPKELASKYFDSEF